ncbi:MAG: TrmH family RNA methyltransferase [Bacteroidetes bacterium]|nr:MAG: TrmH family RNA methyltransferase [Bacteroidota bacterium]
MEKLSMQQLGRHSAEAFKQLEKLPLVVVLDNVRSMHNVGSIFRSADAFKIHSIYLCGFTPQPPHRDIHKTALGSTETVAWQYFENTIDAITQLQNQGYTILAAEQTSASTPLQQYSWAYPQPLAVVFGNEVDGVSQAAINLCHAVLEIPQMGTKHSLNISVAGGIVLWQLAQQTLPAKP